MLRGSSILVLCYIFVGAIDTLPNQPQCASSIVKIGVKSQRSQTGHWVSQFGLIQDTPTNQNGNKTEPWEINVEQKSTVCQNKEQSLETVFFITSPSTSKEDIRKGVPEGYELFAGVGYYKFHSQVTSWLLARQVCAGEGAHLAIINSEQEAAVMKTLFGRYPTIPGASNNDWAWIGLQLIGDNFFTIFGDAMETTGFQRWSATEPHKGKQFCGLIGRAEGALADHMCDWKVAFVCEFDTN